MTLTETRSELGSRVDARSRLLAELAAAPARRGYGIAYDLLGNRAEAEEAVQEALVRACESIGDLRDTAAAPAWFLRIVTTMCLRTLRRRRLKRRLFGWWPGMSAGDEVVAGSASATVSADTGLGDLAERVHATGASVPREALADEQERRSMFAHLGGLAPQQRTALVLRYGHDLPVQEVAALLGVELATAKTHLVRGLARLRQLMEDHR
ncbi:MAG: sigma-70 family RNA polymerase sigma factor [Proteobacteria bacterium]|nr:sigma-70 family RNA polymerase sigma factor [Pseudomonadota bacterium]